MHNKRSLSLILILSMMSSSSDALLSELHHRSVQKMRSNYSIFIYFNLFFAILQIFPVFLLAAEQKRKTDRKRRMFLSVSAFQYRFIKNDSEG